MQDPKRKVHKPVKGVLKLEIEKLQTNSVDFEHMESGSMIFDSVENGPLNAFSKSNSFERKELTRNGSVGNENPDVASADVSLLYCFF